MELRELKEENSDIILCYEREFTDLQKREESTTKLLKSSVALLQKAADMLGGQLANMASRLEREQADHDEVQDCLNCLLDHVATHVLRVRDA